jgi:methyltransferase-like protein/2-polyprenyl-3-methyl-5-hydroxy-6-metoxy-1,4-benzoquinol methylase
MSEAAATSYDEVPYSSNVFSYTHPDCLATWATLLGMDPAPVERCRVLELGCGTGANLIPMAQDLPGSRFVGIDLSPRQVGMGREVVGALGLANIELRPLSILDVGADFGRFDYIICHGVYSWVPAEVQDKILSVCAGHLAPQGVAYVSYNTYPGWHIRGMIREMMGYHVRQFDEPQVRVQQARALLDFLTEAVGDPTTVYGGLLQTEAELLQASPDTYVYHEHLEEVNHPVYFYQFAERAAAKGLQYLGEARPSLLVKNLSPRVTETLEGLATDLLRGEQYLDFVRNRTFRRTMLCHRDVPLRRPPSPDTLAALHVTGVVRPVAAHPDVDSAAVEQFSTPDGARLSTNNPLVKAALVTLAEAWPGALPFEALWAGACSRLGPAAPGPSRPDGGRRLLAESMLQCYLSNLVELHLHAPGFVLEPGERPVASPLARFQAAAGGPVTNRRHRTAELDAFDRLVLRHLDGSRDRAALLDALAEAVANDIVAIEREGRPVRDAGEVRDALSESLGPSLHRLASSALLIG